jgi:DNA-binding SARP family transcriptional activator
MLRRLLALLLANSGSSMSTDLIVELLWAGRPPRTARATVSAYVSRLRQLLANDGRIDACGGSYVIHIDRCQLDTTRFRDLAAQSVVARDQGNLVAARASFQAALALWRGTAFDGLRDLQPVAAEADSLERLRLATFENWIDTELDTDLNGLVMIELEKMIAEHPYRERLRGQHMLALYRAGRQAEALESYRRTYQVLVDDLGVEPTHELTQLHHRILTADPTLIATTRAPIRSGTATGSPAYAVPYQLPRALFGFTGRDDELRRIDQVAARRGGGLAIAVLIGTAGVGKPNPGM